MKNSQLEKLIRDTNAKLDVLINDLKAINDDIKFANINAQNLLKEIENIEIWEK